MRAVWQARARADARLLRDSGLSVSEMAYHCGFRVPFHFSRWVRVMEDRTPAEVRAKAWRRPGPDPEEPFALFCSPP
ncbi:MAG: helix-turn-helix domain-containing protein [Chitinophagaceae bacterium]|nr:helix-turn-helix domain-containing protein [Rubrivivax sp.]